MHRHAPPRRTRQPLAWRALALFWLACWLVAGQAHAHQSIPMAVWQDPDGQATIEQVASPEMAERFRPVGDTYSGGYTRQASWLRLTLTPPTGRPGLAILVLHPPYLDHLSVYLPGPTPEQWEVHHLGDRRAPDPQAVPYRSPALWVTFPSSAPLVAYVRLSTTSSSLLLPHLLSPADFVQEKTTDYALHGLLFGGLLAITLHTLLSGLWRHDPDHRVYLAYQLVTLFYLFALQGFPREWLPDLPPWVRDHWVSVGVLGNLLTSTYLMPRLLDINEQQTPRLQRAVKALRVVLAVCLLTPFVGIYTESTPLLLIVTQGMVLVFIGRAVMLMRQRRAGATAVLISLLLSMSQSTALILSLLGLVNDRHWPLMGNQFVLFPVLVALSLAMGERARAQNHQRHAAERQARDAQETAEREQRARREQSRFVSMLSHEIKTPLSTILAASHNLRHASDLTDPGSTVRLQRIDRAVDRIDRLIDQFLQQDRIEAGELRLEARPVNLRALCDEVARQAEAPQRLGVTGEPVWVQADPHLLALVLGNLVGNATKYGPGDSTIALRLWQDAQGAHVSVTDQGPGLPANVREQLFQRYVRGQGHGHLPGSGLGLYLSRTIASLHHGTLSYAPGESGGAVFTLHLPASAISAAPKPESNHPAGTQAGEA
jgi:signal transduction histidine kinase